MWVAEVQVLMKHKEGQLFLCTLPRGRFQRRTFWVWVFSMISQLCLYSQQESVLVETDFSGFFHWNNPISRHWLTTKMLPS